MDKITIEMVRDVLWSDILDIDDYEGIAQSINMREGVGTTCAENVRELIEVFNENIAVPDIDKMTQMNNLNIVY